MKSNGFPRVSWEPPYKVYKSGTKKRRLDVKPSFELEQCGLLVSIPVVFLLGYGFDAVSDDDESGAFLFALFPGIDHEFAAELYERALLEDGSLFVGDVLAPDFHVDEGGVLLFVLAFPVEAAHADGEVVDLVVG